MADYLTSPNLDGLAGIRHGFFTRRGGVSAGIYESLNAGPGSSDDRQSVWENRRRCRAALNQAEPPLVTVHQVHSADVVRVTAPWDHAEAPRADGLVTDRPGLLLGVLAADCAPILLADPAAGVIGAAHAGWGGAFKGIAGAVVDAMAALGARREAIIAAIGPCIGPRSYEVGPEFRQRFLDQDPANERFFTPGTRPDHPLFDLPGFVTDRLGQTGVSTVAWLGADTLPDPGRFFSYRRATLAGEPDYGRQLSAIALVD
jgi:hypothetical protein